jgi:hypothetical protein
VVPPPHTVLHVPQFALSVCSLTQPLPHATSGVVHVRVHLPAAQTCAPLQSVPQAPQSLGLVAVSTHWPPQDDWPAGQAHVPLVQLSPPVHATPQAPQSRSSEVRLTQALVQSVRPVPQVSVQTPAEQTSPAGQGAPHAPQSCGFDARSTHAPEQNAGVVPCVQAHALETHT